MGTMNRVLVKIERWIIGLAALAIFASCCVMVMEVINRFLFHNSFDWASQLIRLLMIFAVFLTMGPALRHGIHVRILVAVSRMPVALQKAALTIVNTVGTCIMAFLTWWGIQLLISQYQMGLVPIEGLPLPNYLLYSPVPLGTGITCLYFANEMLRVFSNGPAVVDSHSEILGEKTTQVV